MSIVVTGATGHLGRLVVEALLRRGVPASEIVATGRSTDKIKDLADRGVTVRHVDFTDRANLAEAFAGAEKVLLVSSSEIGQRTGQHHNVIDAARAAGVSLLAYTSIANADSIGIQLAAEHKETEQYLRASGVPSVVLRNGWYVENYTDQLATVLQHRAVLGCAGHGRVSAATRADYAEAAAVVLTSDGHADQVYELGGDHAFSLLELAAEISAATGLEVAYNDLPAATFTRALVDAGLPADFAGILADADLGLRRDGLLVETGDLSRLLGRPSTTLAEAIAAAQP